MKTLAINSTYNNTTTCSNTINNTNPAIRSVSDALSRADVLGAYGTRNHEHTSYPLATPLLLSHLPACTACILLPAPVAADTPGEVAVGPDTVQHSLRVGFLGVFLRHTPGLSM